MVLVQFQSTHPSRGATNVAVMPEDWISISIHAPLTGCDQAAETSGLPVPPFQSTHPSRGATSPRIFSGADSSGFQSTHPSRGATKRLSYRIITLSDFNPRTPHGVRQFVTKCPKTVIFISIHAPLTGCDDSRLEVCAMRIVFQSTHPSRGATSAAGLCMIIMMYFNPRTPHGVRHQTQLVIYCIGLFQSTHPSRGATKPKF